MTPTFTLTPDRSDLAREFRARPFGPHSLELHAALCQLRRIHPNGKFVLIPVKPDEEWALAEIRGDPPRAHRLPRMVFQSLEAAEWAVFTLRWRLLTGHELTLD